MSRALDHLDQAVSRHQGGDFSGATGAYRAALAADPTLADAHALFGVLQAQQGHAAAACGLIRTAIALAPQRADFYAHLGGAKAMQGDAAAAASLLRRALRLKPETIDAHTNLGRIHTGLGELGDAVLHLRAALAIAPAQGEATLNLADALRRRGDPVAAEQWARRAVLLLGRRWETLLTLAQALADLGRLTEAVDTVDEACRHAPGQPHALWGAALILLGSGALARGWPMFEARFAANPQMEYPFSRDQQWRGETLAGMRLLVWWEQGIGDEIFFASCLPELAAAQPGVTVGCDTRLAPLFRRSFPGVDVVAARSLAELRRSLASTRLDRHIPSGSLAALLRPQLARFARQGGYLKADPAAVAAWRARLDDVAPGLRVGILWRGLMATQDRGHSYTALADWAAMFAVPGISFVDLQYGDTEQERLQAPEAARNRLCRFPELDLRDDFDGVAALMEALDLIIAPNTAAITLAGALGRPAWVLSRGFDWMRLGTSGYPWAPSIRCFLAPPQEPWTTVLATVAEELRALAGGHRASA